MSAAELALACAVSFAVSALSGMGIGGGGLFVIYLTFIAGKEQFASQGINLWFFIAASLSSLFYHIRKRTVNVKLVLFLSFCGTAGCIAGALMAGKAPPELLKRIFGIFLISAGGWTVLKSGGKR